MLGGRGVARGCGLPDDVSDGFWPRDVDRVAGSYLGNRRVVAACDLERNGSDRPDSTDGERGLYASQVIVAVVEVVEVEAFRGWVERDRVTHLLMRTEARPRRAPGRARPRRASRG